jgi:H+/Cl- antiporter ClcA/CBS domain-containing protein
MMRMSDEELPEGELTESLERPLEETLSQSSLTEGLPVAAGLSVTLANANVPRQPTLVNRRTLIISLLAILIGIAAGYISLLLKGLIGLITNFVFYGRFSFQMITPFDNHLGLWVIVIPVIGGLIIGMMARYGDKGIRGHGMPEAIEGVVANESRMHSRLTVLKPLSAAIAIGTGGPFGAEGPIIATGAALGSMIGQVVRTTAMERKTLLAAGAAGGMAATFGSPVAAVLLAMEVLLFEFRPRSLIPVALACTSATAVRFAHVGMQPIFGFTVTTQPTYGALVFYVVAGAFIGTAGVLATKLLYWLEDQYEKLPLHWMWWPAIGGVAIGVIGYFEPRTLGVGYINISGVLNGSIVGWAALSLAVMKLISWIISLASGTSGGTIAPLFIIGGAFGSVLGKVGEILFPMAHIDIRIAALVGMAAIFAGASRAMLTAVVFAFETTLQPLGLLPLLGGCSAAYLISSFLMKNTLFTENVVRRGFPVPTEFSADDLEQQLVKNAYTKDVISLNSSQTIHEVRDWLKSKKKGSHHHDFPVLDENGLLLGIVNYREIMETDIPLSKSITNLIARAPAVIYEDNTLRLASDHMVREQVGRLPVVLEDNPGKMIGILSRSDILAMHDKRLRETYQKMRNIRIKKSLKKIADESKE